MTVEFVLFLSPEGIALAHRQQAGHWALIGDTALDVPDLGSALAGLREMGETRGGANFPTLLVLPDDQLLYTELDGLGGSAAIPGRLGGLTPYAVEELAYDWRDLGGGRAALAVVARETLDEAEGFARDNGFNGVGFAASPPVEKFPGVPLFQLADDARGLTMPDSGLAFGPDSWTPVVDEISSAPDPVPDPAPEPVPEAPPVDDPAPEAPAEPELETAPPDEVDDTPDLTPVVKSRTARQGKASSAPAAPPAPDDASQDDPTDTPDDGPMQMPTGFGARRGKAPAPEGEAGSLVSERVSRFGLTAPARDDTVAPVTPAENATPVTQKTPNKDIPTGLSAPPRAQPVETSNAPGRRLTPEPDRRLGDMPLPTPPATDQDELAGMQDTPAPGFAARIMARKSADTIPDPVILTRTAEADMPGMDGLLARRAPDRSGPSLKTGLILTLILLLILALVAVWSALFLPDSTVARWLGREAPDVQVATPVPSAIVEAPATADRSEDLARLEQPETPVIAPVPLPPAPPPEAAAEPDLPDIDADLDLGPDPVDPETLLPSPEETEAAYATSGIWQRPPEQPVLPDPDAEDEIYMASIDPVVVTHDALALPGAELTPARLEHYASPPPFGTRFDLDANGLIRPTADGAFTPDGVQVFAGVPPVRPVPRTGGEVTETPETGDNAETEAVQTALLASFQPTPRPADLTERRERQLLGGFTVSELANRRPSPRPPSVQQLTLAAREAEAATTPSEQGTAGATFDADVLAGNAEPEVRVIQASALAVASSQTPRLRPGNFADTVARATQGRADQSGAATIQTASAPARVQPSIPSSATVSRAATNSNAINLRRVNLIGVSGTSSNRRALVRMPSGRFVRVTVGDRVDGGRVAAIGENTLQYVKNGRNITLEVPG